jgi:hypothetical protein
MPVKRFFALLLTLFSVMAVDQSPHVKSGAAAYVDPMNGYETHLVVAAVAKQQVPLIEVTDK